MHSASTPRFRLVDSRAREVRGVGAVWFRGGVPDPDETSPADTLAPSDTPALIDQPADSENEGAGDRVGPVISTGLRAIVEEARSAKGNFSPEFVKMIERVFPEEDVRLGLPGGTMSIISDVVSKNNWGIGMSAEDMSMFRDAVKVPDWLGSSVRAGELFSGGLSDASLFAGVLTDPPFWMAPVFRATEQIDGILSDSALVSASIRAVWNDTLAAHTNVNGAALGFSNTLRPFLEDLSVPAWLGPVIESATWKSAFDTYTWDLQLGVPPGLLELFNQLPFPDLGLSAFHLPPNWHDIDADPDDIEEKVKTILEEAIPLGWVPSARVIELLLEAPDRSARRRVIINNYRGILTDCEDISSGLSAPGALGYADSIRRAIRAIRDGHADAAQALASNVLDTVVTHYTAKATTLAMPWKVLTNASSYKRQRKLGWRILLSLYPLSVIIGGTHTPFTPTSEYRRNATVHAVAREQYTRTNAVLAIMNATAVLACYVRDTEAFD